MTGKRVSPHTLRHSCAIHTLEATGDIRKVSLWLGHKTIRSTEIYLRADPVEKLDILAAGHPPSLRKGSFNDAPDRLLAILRDAKAD
ncbi:MAG: tyrosine-type recombinase/integrase [Rhodospirillaceae bacterium]|nr:tyrosine-type recombinase/integrase [Rhodospirillaceae bacterium]MYH39121.1 tyrosine-type recombinase/integrase [Rhodospirillaceae bacterium]MYK14495.1 tyrosine-type recombinase/integrase [Rhodospirillaceae bacterium]